jgi:hopanoid C-3 methylase
MRIDLEGGPAMRILLVQPDSNRTCIGFKRLARPEPLALQTVAASAPEHELRIFDMRVDPDLETALREFQPEVVGTTGFTAEVPHAKEICRTARRMLPGLKIVVGGHHATMSPPEFDSPDVDALVVGEGDRTFPELLQALEGGKELSGVNGIAYRKDGVLTFTPPRDPVRNLDDVPWPRRDLVSQYRSSYFFRFWDDIYSIETTRGCPHRCTFCSVWKFYGGSVRFKSPERVVAEIETIPEDRDYFAVVDDNFLASMPRTRKIVNLMRDRGIRKRFWIQGRADAMARDPGGMAALAQAGLSTVLIGLESYREGELANFNKGKDASLAVNDQAIDIMHENGIDIWGCFLIDPSWEERDFQGLIEYVKRKRIQFLQFTILTPLPGTQFYEETKHLIQGGWEKFDFFHSVLPTRLPPERFYEQMATLYRETVMSFSQLKEMIRQGRIPRTGLQRAKDMLAQVMDPSSYLDPVPSHADLGSRVSARLAQAQAALEQLHSEVSTVQVELGARLQSHVHEAQEELRAAQQDLRGLQADMSALWEGRLHELQSQVDAMQQDLNLRLRSPLEGLRSEVREGVRQRANGLRLEMETLRTEMETRLQLKLDSLHARQSQRSVLP